jgi:hypothetical protein
MVQKHQENGGLGEFMSKLDEAQQRLQQAVSGLEEAARTASTSLNAQDSGAATSAELEAMKTRNAALENANTAVAQRLDGAIAQIKEILDD